MKKKRIIVLMNFYSFEAMRIAYYHTDETQFQVRGGGGFI